MSENEKRDKTTPPPLRGTSPYTGEAREKVIMGLEWALENMVDPTNDFRFAGYDGPCVLLNQPIVSDALALLKAQEPLDVSGKTGDCYCSSGHVGYCPKCGAVLLETTYNPKYCGVCGQAVKWG